MALNQDVLKEVEGVFGEEKSLITNPTDRQTNMLPIIWVVASVVLCWLFHRSWYSRFKKSGVKHFKPLPVVGNMKSDAFLGKHLFHHITTLYKAFPCEKFVGQYEFKRPMVYLRDLALIKKVVVDDAELFPDHRTITNADDPVFGRIVYSLKGQEWRDMRATLEPAFTSSYIEEMFPFILEVGQRMISSLKRKIQESGTTFMDLDAKDLSSRYVNDVIASCVFGLRIDSLTNPNNEFYKQSQRATTFGFLHLLKYIGSSWLPWLMKKMKVTFFSKESKLFFEDLVLSTMEYRETHGISRPDVINVLMEARKGRSCPFKIRYNETADFETIEKSTIGDTTIQKAWSDEDLVVQSLVFFLAGYDSVVTALKFILYELAMNPDVQQKLTKEVLDHVKASDGKLDLNSIQQMTYMDMVVSETLRLWPPGLSIDRICNQDYNLGKPNNDKAAEDYIIKCGECVCIPICAIHRDPTYYPNPEKFDPDRFSKKNRTNIPPMAFMPFGLGPRQCLGSQFALCEVKLMVYQLLQHFEVVPCKRTRKATEISINSICLEIKWGHWMRFQLRH